MALVPQSLRVTAYQQWGSGTPPQPNGERVDLWEADDQGTVYHKWWDGVTNKWSGWESLGHP